MDVITVFLFFVLQILSNLALPVKNDTNNSCIHMTPERLKELNDISEEFNKFINKLSDKYEDIDFTFVEVKVENHTEDEDEEKETTLKITVKDCDSTSKKLLKIEDKYYNNDDITDTVDDGENLGDDNDKKDKQHIKNDKVETNQELDITDDENINSKKVRKNILEKNEDINIHNESVNRNLNKTIKKTYINENIDETENVLVKRINKHINRTEVDSDIDQHNIYINERNENNKKIERNVNKIERDNEKIERDNIKTKDKLEDSKVYPTNNLNTRIIKNERVKIENEAKNLDKTIDNIDKDVSRNIIIYAPYIDNRVIEIGGFENYLQNILYKLAANHLSKGQSPMGNLDFSQHNADYDAYFDYMSTDNKEIDDVTPNNKQIDDVSTDKKLIVTVLPVEDKNDESKKNFEDRNDRVATIDDAILWR